MLDMAGEGMRSRRSPQLEMMESPEALESAPEVAKEAPLAAASTVETKTTVNVPKTPHMPR